MPIEGNDSSAVTIPLAHSHRISTSRLSILYRYQYGIEFDVETTFADNHIIRIGASGPVLSQGAKGRLGHANIRVTVVLLCQQNVEAAASGFSCLFLEESRSGTMSVPRGLEAHASVCGTSF